MAIEVNAGEAKVGATVGATVDVSTRTERLLRFLGIALMVAAVGMPVVSLIGAYIRSEFERGC